MTFARHVSLHTLILGFHLCFSRITIVITITIITEGFNTLFLVKSFMAIALMGGFFGTFLKMSRSKTNLHSPRQFIDSVKQTLLPPFLLVISPATILKREGFNIEYNLKHRFEDLGARNIEYWLFRTQSL